MNETVDHSNSEVTRLEDILLPARELEMTIYAAINAHEEEILASDSRLTSDDIRIAKDTILPRNFKEDAPGSTNLERMSERDRGITLRALALMEVDGRRRKYDPVYDHSNENEPASVEEVDAVVNRRLARIAFMQIMRAENGGGRIVETPGPILERPEPATSEKLENLSGRVVKPEMRKGELLGATDMATAALAATEIYTPKLEELGYSAQVISSARGTLLKIFEAESRHSLGLDRSSGHEPRPRLTIEESGAVADALRYMAAYGRYESLELETLDDRLASGKITEPTYRAAREQIEASLRSSQAHASEILKLITRTTTNQKANVPAALPVKQAVHVTSGPHRGTHRKTGRNGQITALTSPRIFRSKRNQTGAKHRVRQNAGVAA